MKPGDVVKTKRPEGYVYSPGQYKGKYVTITEVSPPDIEPVWYEVEEDDYLWHDRDFEDVEIKEVSE